jgi:hypothetical protein
MHTGLLTWVLTGFLFACANVQNVAPVENCDESNPRACAEQAMLLVHKNPENARQAVSLAATSCRGGVWLGCELTALYADDIRHGQFTNGDQTVTIKATPDPEAALPYLELSCNHKNESGCFHLGQMFRDGQVVAQDLSRAVQLMEMACGRDHWTACCQCADLLDQGGAGLPQDTARAATLRERAKPHLKAGCSSTRSERNPVQHQ